MAGPLVALPALGKIGAALKGLFAAKKVAGVTQLAIPGLTAAGKTAAATGAKTGLLGNAKRMAGDAMTAYLGGKPTLGNLGMNYGFDAGFGVLSAIQEPGDLGDKLIRGATTASAGALGGMAGVGAFRGLTGRMPGTGMRMTIEGLGAVGGDMAGYSLGDSLQRAKNDGMTAWEKESLRQQMEDLYASGGGDQFLYQNGLG
jgi:hypothetical protein